jgi:hypothetical protein
VTRSENQTRFQVDTFGQRGERLYGFQKQTQGLPDTAGVAVAVFDKTRSLCV